MDDRLRLPESVTLLLCIIGAALLVLAVLATSGCATMYGAGTDIRNAAAALSYQEKP